MTQRRHLLIRLSLPALIVLGLAVLALIVVNLDVFDQDLDDTSVHHRISLPAGAEGPPADEAMLYMLGLTAASDRDPQQVGAVRLAENGDSADSSGTTDDAARDVTWLDRYPSASCNSRSQLGCLDRLLQDLATQPVEDARLRLMLDRYRALRRRTDFDETTVLQSESSLRPDYGMVLRLARMNAAVALHTQGAGAALSELAADRVFWEMMLRRSDSLLARMVAVAGLWSQLQFVSELIATQSLTPDQLQQAAMIVRALPAEAKDLGSAFATEQRMLPVELRALRARSSLPRRFFIALSEQPNATSNRFNRQVTRPMVELAGESPAEFRRRVDQDLAPDFGYRVFPPGLYNLGGTMLLQSFRSVRPWDYIGRVHDLSGMLGLVRLQIEIAQARSLAPGPVASNDQVQEVIASSRERDPYSGQAMQWDQVSQTLGFNCYGESICKVRIRSHERSSGPDASS
jgi:hypothetical protein